MEKFLDRLRFIVGKMTNPNKPKSTVFAENAKIPPGTFHKYWKEGAFPIAEHLIRISEYSGCSIDWLLTGRGEMFLEEQNAVKYHPSLKGIFSIPSDCPADPVCKEICNMCMNSPPEDRNVLIDLYEILNSGDKEGIIKAVKHNLEQLRRLVPEKQQAAHDPLVQPDSKVMEGRGKKKKS